METILIADNPLIEAWDRFNRAIQAEIEDSPAAVALELAQIKLEVNRMLDKRRRSDGLVTTLR